MENHKIRVPIHKSLKTKISRIKLFTSVALLATVFALIIYSVWYVRKTTETVSEAGPQAKLVLEPSKGDFHIGEVYPLFVVLDTQSSDVNAVDLKIVFDKDIFEIVDQDSTKPGIQIASESNIFSYVMVNSSDNSTGEVKYTAITYDVNNKMPTKPFNGKKPIATIKFRPKKSTAGSKFSFRYSPNATNDSNIADSISNQDILAEVKDALFKISAPVVSVNARGVGDKSIAPKLKLSIKEGAVEKVYSEENISNTDYNEIFFPISQSIANGNIIYFDFDNDTRDALESKPGSSNRDIYVKNIKVGDRTFYLDPQNDIEKKQAAKDRDEGRIYYDRADREDGTLYDGGKFGPFGNARDGAKNGSKYILGYLEYGMPLGFGPNYTGQMLWNGAIVIKVDWLISSTPNSITSFESIPIPSVSVTAPIVISTPKPSLISPIGTPTITQAKQSPGEPITTLCTEPTGEKYASAFLQRSLNTIDPANNPNFNLGLRGYQKVNNESLKTFLDGNVASDLLSPNLINVLNNTNIPEITGAYKINSSTLPVSMIALRSAQNQIISAPSSGYILNPWDTIAGSENYKSVVIYADNNRIALNYTLDDITTTGYTVYLENICVDSNLISAYKEASPSGTIKRTKLPAIKAYQPIGRVNGTEILVAISNKGKFVDPRIKSDWFR